MMLKEEEEEEEECTCQGLELRENLRTPGSSVHSHSAALNTSTYELPIGDQSPKNWQRTDPTPGGAWTLGMPRGVSFRMKY